MTISEIQRSNHADQIQGLVQNHELYPSIVISGRNRSYEAQFVNQMHPDVPVAKAIEKFTFIELGDLPEEVDEEFQDYDENSIFLLLRKLPTAEGSDGRTETNGVMGMARFLPYSQELGNKTFNDLASIVFYSGQERPDGSAFEGFDGLDEEQITAKLVGNFCLRHSCDDVEKVIDIATLAPDMSLDIKEKMDVVESLLKAMDVFVLGLHERGQLTHLTQFTEEKMHGILKDHMGYPMHSLFDSTPILYDTFGNHLGTDANIIAVPSVIVLEQLKEVFRSNYLTPSSRHMASVTTQLAVSFPSVFDDMDVA